MALSQQKAKLEAQGKVGGKDSADDVLAFNNKTIAVKNLKDKIASLQEEVCKKCGLIVVLPTYTSYLMID